MQKLIRGVQRFQQDIFGEKREFFEKLADGQSPEALFITCSDSRIIPNLITQTEPGDVFIIRNAGNLVPAHGAIAGGESATIEYAVSVLGVRHIIVCGHSNCGAMKALLEPGSTRALPQVDQWLCHAAATRQIVERNYKQLCEGARLMATVQENVLVQLGHVRTHPCVASGLAAGTIRLHGWVYKLEAGEIFAFDDGVQQFIPLRSAANDMDPRGRLLSVV
jgi:carbonic anhydrase